DYHCSSYAGGNSDLF
nr:immunoglobulin light chain junction region [Macaca mulatta]